MLRHAILPGLLLPLLLLGPGCGTPVDRRPGDREALRRLADDLEADRNAYEPPATGDLGPALADLAGRQGGIRDAVCLVRARAGFSLLDWMADIGRSSANAVLSVPDLFEFLDIPFVVAFGWVKQFFRQAAGSGIILDEDGWILTNRHLVEGADEAWVYLRGEEVPGGMLGELLDSERRRPARVVWVSERVDAALLRIRPGDAPYPHLSVGSAAGSLTGRPALAVGYPFRGIEETGPRNPTVTFGVVTSTDVLVSEELPDLPGDPDPPGFVLTDAAINPGNSGGPLVDGEGRVLGVASFMVGGAENLGYAVPVDWIVHALRLDLGLEDAGEED